MDVSDSFQNLETKNNKIGNLDIIHVKNIGEDYVHTLEECIEDSVNNSGIEFFKDVCLENMLMVLSDMSKEFKGNTDMDYEYLDDPEIDTRCDNRRYSKLGNLNMTQL